MLKNSLAKVIFFSALYVAGINTCFAQALDSSAFSPIKTINPNAAKPVESGISIDLNKGQSSSKIINLSENDTFYNFNNATDKFVQCNIRASWDDFKTLINTSPNNDFIYMSFANKMADLGLFDLSNLATTKIQDKDIANVSIDAMKRFYYPRKKLKLEDELFLAETYSNILYNNQSSEATNELLKNETLLSNSDYANYIAALGSYKSSLYSRAAKYINIAVIQNQTNLNYQKLKAQILADDDKPEEALKTVENLKKTKLKFL